MFESSDILKISAKHYISHLFCRIEFTQNRSFANCFSPSLVRGAVHQCAKNNKTLE